MRQKLKVVQINVVYEKLSTGRSTKELHEFFLENDVDSYVATCFLEGLESSQCIKIGNIIDRKIHALCSRMFGLQMYFSHVSTFNLIRKLKKIEPNIIILHVLHGNYINLRMLLKYIEINNIGVIFVTHDSWFYAGKCVYYIEDSCEKWKKECGNCPALKKGNASWFFDCSKKMLNDKKKWYEMIKKKAVICVSKWVEEDVKKSILGDSLIIQCIYNWIDLDIFKPRDTQKLREDLDLNGKKIILGVAAIWCKEKGIQIFEQIADSLSDEFRILLVGEVPNKKIDNKMIYLGAIHDAEKLAQLYSMADIFLNPSIQETFGKTTAEALSCGTPVVAFNNTAMPELIGREENCGCLVDQNVDSVLSAIDQMMSSGIDYGSNCRKRAMKLFDKNKNIKQYMNIIKTLCEDNYEENKN